MLPALLRVAAIATFLALPFAWTVPALAAGDTDVGTAILRDVDAADRGGDLVWDVTIDLTDRLGTTRSRSGKILRKVEPLDGGKRKVQQITVFLEPSNIRHTALLKVDDAEEEFLWLYLSALKKVKRVPPAERGDKFVGTDFTVEDIDLGFKYRDYSASVIGQRSEAGIPLIDLRVEPKSDELKSNLGYDYAIMTVRRDINFLTHQTYHRDGKVIRENLASNFQRIDGIWTALELTATDRIDGHTTVLSIRKASYNTGLSSALFAPRTLSSERIN